jgi:hypothetical protein
VSRRLAALLLFVPGGFLRAQEASVLLGATHARYADSLAGSGGFGAARFVLGHRLRALRTDLSYSAFTTGGWALQAGGQATLLGGRGPFFGVALGGSINTYSDGAPNGSVAGGPLVAIRVGPSLGSIGAAVGASRRIDSTWIGLGSVAMRWQSGLTSETTIDLGVTGTAADTLRFVDLALGLHWTHGPLTTAGVAGVRVGDLADGMWATVDMNWHPVDPVGVEFAAGRYPRDIVGFAQGWYVQGGVRLYAINGPRRRAMPVEIRRVDARTVVVTVHVRRAIETLAIAGDWNGWTPVPMRHRQNDEWSVRLPLDAGVYQYALTSDGHWLLPDGVVGADDGFGGRVGTLVIRP